MAAEDQSDDTTAADRRQPKEDSGMKLTDAQEIRAAFPDDPEFALEQIVSGATLADAKVAYADKLIAKNAELTAELENARLSARRPGTRPVPTEPTDGAGGGRVIEDARLSWRKAVQERKARGLDNAAAVRSVIREDAQLHQEYLRSCNQHPSRSRKLNQYLADIAYTG